MSVKYRTEIKKLKKVAKEKHYDEDRQIRIEFLERMKAEDQKDAGFWDELLFAVKNPSGKKLEDYL